MIELTNTSRLYLIAIAVSFIIAAGVSYFVYSFKDNSNSQKLFLITAIVNLLLISSSLYAFIENQTVSVLLYYINTISQVTIPLLWYLFSISYFKNEGDIFSVTTKTITYVYSAFIILLATNEFHKLYGTIIFVSEKGLSYPTIEQTIFINIIIISGFSLLFATVYKLYLCFKGSKHRKTRYLTGVLMLAVVVLIIPFSITQFGLYTLPLEQFDHSVFGSVAFFIVIAISITEFGFLEIQPQAKEELFNRMEEGVLILNLKEEITEFNYAAKRVFPEIKDGICLNELSKWPFSNETPEQLTQQENVHKTISVNGEEKHFIISVSKITQSGKPTGFFFLFRDITELKDTKNNLKQRNEELNQFSHTIAHDLRNPLSVASGYTEIVQTNLQDIQETSDLDVSESITYMRKIEDSFERMEAIIEDVLTMVDGKTIQKENLETCQLQSIAEEAWEQVETRGSEFKIEKQAQEYSFKGDKTKIQTIFENIYRNSLEHCQDPEITVGLEGSGFFIADDGDGVDEEIVDSLFEYGVSKSDSGTGLGLSIVETLANAHSWTVTYDKDYADGAKFVFQEVSAK